MIVKQRYIPKSVIEHGGNETGEQRAGLVKTGISVYLNEVWLKVVVEHKVVSINLEKSVK